MKRWAVVLVFVLLTGAAGAGGEKMATDQEDSMDDEKAVRDAVDQWFVVLNAMLNGDPKPFAELYSHADDATYMGAEGTFRIGWDAIHADWTAQAEKSSSGTVEGHDIHIVVGGDMAMAAHYTKGAVKRPDGQIAENLLRETSVFRKEDGQWRIIGHHADGLPYWEKAFDE
ncbi:MAG: SgcJ/EcaC family oxidoreductase [Alphaproteobacteria bacterium]|nr:SgcJ/EcaC family oxidoreductase [Alphaproteobacteria bacterium]